MIDWQMYEDGLLEPEEMRRAEQALASDQGARKELQGLREFRKVVRTSALQEPVPLGRLRAILRAVIGRDRQPAWRLYAALAATAAAAAALAFFAVGLFPNGAQPVVSRTEAEPVVYRSFESPQAAQRWAAGRSGLDLPTIELASIGQLQGVHCAEAWACYDFTVDGRLVHVYMRAGGVVPGCAKIVRDGRAFFLPPIEETICFSNNGGTFAVHCDDEDLRWKVAEQAAKEAEVVY